MLRRVARSIVGSLQQGLTSAAAQDASLPSTSGSQALLHALEDLGSSGLVLLRSKYSYAFKRAADTPGLVFWKPSTPGQRHKISIDYEALGVYTGPPVPGLSNRVKATGGRNENGRVSVRGRGGGALKIVRSVDYTRPGAAQQSCVVERIEADPNRTAFLALARYDSGPGGQPVYKYHIAPHGVRVGDVLMGGPAAPITAGSVLKLRDIPLGQAIHNLELRPGGGGQMVRAAGTSAVIQYKEEKHAVIKLPSSEVRRIPLDCRATIGSVSNHLNKFINLGKAGANRQRGRRPKVRGIAMNPVDHPHGGRTNGGRPSCTPWGVYCKGQRTRLRNKLSNKDIILRKGGQPIEKFVAAKKWRAAAEKARKAKSGAPLPPAPKGPPAVLLGPVAPAWGSARRR